MRRLEYVLLDAPFILLLERGRRPFYEIFPDVAVVRPLLESIEEELDCYAAAGGRREDTSLFVFKRKEDGPPFDCRLLYF